MVNVRPVHVAKFLEGIDYPVNKADLLKHAAQYRADGNVLATLEQLPDQTFEGAFGLSKAIGKIGREERELAGPRADRGRWEKFAYQSEAGSREYFVYTPANYQIGSAVPLLVMLHGCVEGAEDFAAVTQMNQLADQKQCIVVYPQQARGDNQEQCWDWFESSNQSRGSGEPALLAGITQTVKQNTSRWTIDTSRVYVAGLSAGAAMVVILGVTYPDLFAAIGVHSGLEYEAASSQQEAFMAMFLRGGPDPMQQGQLAYHTMGINARVVPTIVF